MVCIGLFKWVCYFIYMVMMVFGFGLLLVILNFVVFVGFILFVVMFEVYVCCVEEFYLLWMYSVVYCGYIVSVGWFVLGVGLIC